jgi:hypothetical protein
VIMWRRCATSISFLEKIGYFWCFSGGIFGL